MFSDLLKLPEDLPIFLFGDVIHDFMTAKELHTLVLIQGASKLEVVVIHFRLVIFHQFHNLGSVLLAIVKVF